MSSDTHHGASHNAAHDAAHDAEHIKHYNKIFMTLMVLFLVSWAGPWVGDQLHSKALVLVTAFGIALVKAYLVCAHFMHLNVEKKYITYLLTTALALMFLFFTATAPDVMEHFGDNWVNTAAQNETTRALKAIEEAQHTGDAHGAAHH